MHFQGYIPMIPGFDAPRKRSQSRPRDPSNTIYIYIYSILHNKSIELNPMKNSPQTSISLNSHEIPMNFVSNLSGPIKIPDFGHLLAHQLSGCAAA